MKRLINKALLSSAGIMAMAAAFIVTTYSCRVLFGEDQVPECLMNTEA